MRYPSPALETKNSPAITPTRERPMLIFREPKRVPMLLGRTIFRKIWLLVAPKVAAMRMASRSVRRKPPSISKTVTIREIASAIKMMASVPAPTTMIITGPRAILGRLLRTTK